MYGAVTLGFSYRVARYDVLVMLEVTGLFLAASIEQSKKRFVALALLGIPLAWTSLTSLTYLAGLSMIIVLVTGWRWWREMVAAAAGATVGLVSYLAWIRWLGLTAPLWKNIVLGTQPTLGGEAAQAWARCRS